MRKLAAWHLWLEGCALCTMMGLGVAQAAQPELVIATEEDVGAFAVAAPFELSNAVLNVQTSFSTARDFRLSGYQAIHVAPDVHFELAGEISSEIGRASCREGDDERGVTGVWKRTMKDTEQ